MKALLLAATLVAAAVPAVHAADLIVVDPVAPVAMTDAGFDWSGFYAGLNGGYANATATSVGATTGATTNINVTGGLIGATLGFNGQFDNFVLGLEGDVAWSGATGSSVCVNAPAFNCAGNLNWLGTVKARAGVAIDSVLLFATAGFAAGGITANVTPVPAGATGTFSGTMTGWTVGGGAEVAVTEAISVKAEYNYIDLRNLQAPGGTISTVQANNLSATNHVVKVGVNFHF